MNNSPLHFDSSCCRRPQRNTEWVSQKPWTRSWTSPRTKVRQHHHHCPGPYVTLTKVVQLTPTLPFSLYFFLIIIFCFCCCSFRNCTANVRYGSLSSPWAPSTRHSVCVCVHVLCARVCVHTSMHPLHLVCHFCSSWQLVRTNMSRLLTSNLFILCCLFIYYLLWLRT